jgi:hypothetical protein
MAIGNLICNTFHVGNFFQISTDFALFERFRKTDLIESWSDRLLKPLLQIHQSSTLDNDYSTVISKDCTMVWETGTHHIPISKKI